jgi:TonB family protein
MYPSHLHPRSHQLPRLPIGAPALIPPLDPPPFIPLPDAAQPRIDIELYTGDIPTIDGPVTLPGAAAGGVSDQLPTQHYEDTVYEIWSIDVRPAIENRAAIEASMQREYPQTFANAGIEGEVIAEFVVLPDGTIDPNTVRIVSASHERFEEATRKVLTRFRFTPGKVRGEPVRVLTSVPIRWTVGR